MASLITLQVTEDDTPPVGFQITRNSTALNITGMTVVCVIKADPRVEDNAVTGVYTLTSGSGLTITAAATGQISIDVPSAVTASPSTWYFKIRVTSGAHTETAVVGWISITDA